MASQQGWRWLVALAAIPLLTALIAAILNVVAGPDWLAYNLDPEYSYLLNALMMAQGEAAPQSLHPGTPVHLLGAAAIRCTHLFVGDAPLPAHVLQHPETYLTAFRVGIVGVHTTAVFGMGVYLARRAVPLGLVLVVQAAPVLSTVGVAALHRVSPEPVLLTIATLLGGVVVLHAVADPPPNHVRFAGLFGLLCGLGLGAKVTFAPLFAVPAVVLPGLRPRAVFAAASAVTFALMLWNPFVQPEGFFEQQARMATTGGVYGERGTLETPAVLWSRVPAWLGEIARLELLTVGLFAAGIFALVWALARRTNGRSRFDPVYAALAAILIAEIGQLALSIKSPVPLLRYLIPAFGLLGAHAALLYVACVRSMGPANPARRRLVRASLALLLLFGAAGARKAWRYGINLQTRAAECLAMRTRVAAVHADDRIAYHYRASAQPFALWFGNEWVDGRYAADLRALYPDALIYDLWEKRFEDCGGAPVTVPATPGGTLPLLQGTPWPALADDLGVVVRQRGSVEWLYGPAPDTVDAAAAEPGAMDPGPAPR